MNLLLATYNNYANRLYRKCDSIADYITNSTAHTTMETVNFNPGDGVSTSHVIGKGSFDISTFTPDYLVVYEDGESGEETIHSR